MYCHLKSGYRNLSWLIPAIAAENAFSKIILTPNIVNKWNLSILWNCVIQTEFDFKSGAIHARLHAQWQWMYPFDFDIWNVWSKMAAISSQCLSFYSKSVAQFFPKGNANSILASLFLNYITSIIFYKFFAQKSS